MIGVITTLMGVTVVVTPGMYLLLTVGRISVWAFQMVLFCAVVFPSWAVLELRAWKRRGELRRLHPDNNFHDVPRFGAVGFDDHGTWILPGSVEDRRLKQGKMIQNWIRRRLGMKELP